YHHRSYSWMEKLCQVVGLLLDYIEANRGSHDKPETLFQAFISALYGGTLDDKGNDSSGLGWLPSSARTVNPKAYMLNEFSDWMKAKGYVQHCVNPWTTATSTEERLNWIAWFRQNGNSFLGHIGISSGTSTTLAQARMVKLRRLPSGKI